MWDGWLLWLMNSPAAWTGGWWLWYSFVLSLGNFSQVSVWAALHWSSVLWVRPCLLPSNWGNFDWLSCLIVMSTSMLWWMKLMKASVCFLFLASGGSVLSLTNVNCRVLHRGLFLVWDSFFSLYSGWSLALLVMKEHWPLANAFIFLFFGSVGRMMSAFTFFVFVDGFYIFILIYLIWSQQRNKSHFVVIYHFSTQVC